MGWRKILSLQPEPSRRAWEPGSPKDKASPDKDSLLAMVERKLQRSLHPEHKHPHSRLAFQDSPLLHHGTWSLTSVY